MTTRNHRIRLAENNFMAKTPIANITVSSVLSGFPFSNCIGQTRSKLFKFSGNFIVDASNNKIYINDGADKIITLVNSSTAYSTGTLLATHIQTQLNASSTGWTVSYDTTLGTYRFRIQRNVAGTLRLSQVGNSTWNILGYLSSVDVTGTSFYADVQRNHTEESITIDLGLPVPMTFIALLGPLGSIFSISNTAVVTLQASNVNIFTSPPYSQTLSVSDKGVMRFLDDADTNYRYFKIKIVDQENPIGPQLPISYLYLGDYVTILSTNVANGFDKINLDPSSVSAAESGVLYFDTKQKYSQFNSMSVNVLSKADKDTLEKAYDSLGKTTPFFISLDPTNIITDTIFELTKLVVFNEMPSFRHIIRDIFSSSISVREIL
jgi:hypothetical protein